MRLPQRGPGGHILGRIIFVAQRAHYMPKGPSLSRCLAVLPIYCVCPFFLNILRPASGSGAAQRGPKGATQEETAKRTKLSSQYMPSFLFFV